MKKIILIFLLLGTSKIVVAQQYEMHVKVSLRSNLNNVRCDSFFKLSFQNKGTTRFEWIKNLDMNESDWGNFEETFSVSAESLIDNIYIWSKRETSDCTTRDQGEGNVRIFPSYYPCWESRVFTGEFPGYDSRLIITIRPLSLSPSRAVPTNLDFHAIQTEAYLKPDNLVRYFAYRVEAAFDDNTTAEILSRDVDDIDRVAYNQRLVLSRRKRIRSITVISELGNFFPTVVTKQYTIEDDGTDLDIRFDSKDPPFSFLSIDSYIHIRFSLPRTPLLFVGDPLEKSLPSSNDIQLRIPERHSDYDWKYSLDNGASFIDLPISFGTDNTITISGEALFGSNWRDQLFRNVLFKAVYSCASPRPRETQTISLTHLPSAPGIVNVIPTMESCFDSRDAQLKIQFDRPLDAGQIRGTPYTENLYIYLNNTDFRAVALDADNTTTIAGLAPGNYTVTLLTRFPPFSNGYSAGTNHTKNTSIAQRTAIFGFSATETHVHCYDGEDGLINVTATGGTGSFNSYLYQDAAEIKQITFTEGTSDTFSGLKAGTYVVKLKDSNGCDPKTGSGQIIEYSRTINQPLQPTFLSTVESVEPLGYGLTDGYITVRSQEGSMPSTFRWTDDHSNVLTPDPPQTEGASQTSRLSNIGKGIYRVRSEDANYALAFPQTEVNVRGCYDTLTIMLDEPPLLEVLLAEYHYVSCHGYSDGELVAHAKGGRPYVAGHSYHPYQYAWFKMENGSPMAFGESDSIATDRPSATYRIKVTDRNGIIAWSPDFVLTQPDALVLNFNTSELLCNGDTNGTSAVMPQGGTMPYRYAWSTEETTSRIENLTDGWYSVVVTDSRGCTTFGQTEVKVPNGLSVDAEVINPTCFQYEDGSIQLVAAGGKPSYQYDWTHGPHTDAITGLREGMYEVTITDGNGCFIVRAYTLESPAPLPIDIGADKALCNGQSLEINAAISDPAARYEWFRNGVPFASTATAQLVDAATYRIEITDSKGCVNSDEINITRDETDIAADFAIATRVPRGERVRVANISHPTPDKIEWIIPLEATVLAQTPDYLEMIFNNYGEYSIGLRTFKGSCEKTEYQTVQAVDRSELTDYETPDEPYIKQFMVTPNSNDGRFTASVELKEKGDFSLIFYSGQGSVIARKEIKGQSFSAVEFDVSSSVSSGIYILQLVTIQGVATFKVMIR